MVSDTLMGSRGSASAEVLRRQHDEIRAELVRAALEPDPIGKAAKRVARLCLPHLEQQEKTLFPIFRLLHDLAFGEAQPEMASVLPLVSHLIAARDASAKQRHAILRAIGALLTAAHAEKNREIANFAYQLRVYVEMEKDVLHPTAILIGHNVRERLGTATVSDPGEYSGHNPTGGGMSARSCAANL